MDFYQWYSMYALRRKIDKRYRTKPYPEAYYELIKFFMDRKDLMSSITCVAEAQWYDYGQPYYKVWPNMAEYLSNTSIDIDGKYLALPFPAYEIRLSKTNPFREHEKAPVLKSLLIHREDYTKGFAVDRETLQDGWADGRDWSLMVQYQFDLPQDDDAMGWYYRMPIKNDIPISDCFQDAWERTSGYMDNQYEPSKEFCQKLVRLAITVAFFGTNQHELIIPDIPTKYIERYSKAVSAKDETEQTKLKDKAKRLHHFGWKIGSSEITLPRPIRVYDNSHSDGVAEHIRELHFAHPRNGHMRLQPYGNKENRRYELIFIPPTIVRPDLPLRPIAGFRIKDSLLEE